MMVSVEVRPDTTGMTADVIRRRDGDDAGFGSAGPAQYYARFRALLLTLC